MDTLIEQAIDQHRELRACMDALRGAARSPMAVVRPVAVVRVIVWQVVIRLHAARSAIEDSAARLIARVSSRASFGTAVRGSWLFGAPFKLL
jgi:hypothetical protein